MISRRWYVCIATSAGLTLGMPAAPVHADDFSDAVIEDTGANMAALEARTKPAPITCQFSYKTGGPIVNPGVNALGAAVFPRDYASTGVQCFSFQQRTYGATLRITLERKVPTGWIAFDTTIVGANAVNGALVIPQTVNDHVYNQIPDPNIGTAGSVHHGKFELTLSTGQVVPIEYTPIPWTMAPW